MAISKKQLEHSWLFELLDESYQEHIKQKLDDEYQYHEYLKSQNQ
jgi:glycine cleavage system H lipoate-binding protein